MNQTTLDTCELERLLEPECGHLQPLEIARVAAYALAVGRFAQPQLFAGGDLAIVALALDAREQLWPDQDAEPAGAYTALVFALCHVVYGDGS